MTRTINIYVVVLSKAMGHDISESSWFSTSFPSGGSHSRQGQGGDPGKWERGGGQEPEKLKGRRQCKLYTKYGVPVAHEAQNLTLKASLQQQHK